MTDVKATRIYYENSLPSKVEEAGNPFGATGSDKEVNVNRGSAGSSKSHSIMQLFLEKFFTEKAKRFLILRKTLPSLRNSVYRQYFLPILADFGLHEENLKKEKTMMNYFFEPPGSGGKENLLHFGGLDDPEKVIKSTEWNYIWVEEATEISFDDFKIIYMYNRNRSADGKPNQIFLTFNPISIFHWLKEDLVDNTEYKDKKEIHSTYKDNPFLPIKAKEKYERLMTQDKNLYRIFALGEWGILTHLVYSNFMDAPSIPSAKELNNNTFYGLDFGFNAPSSLIETTVSDEEEDTCWTKELIYLPGLENRELIQEMKKVIPHERRHLPIYCDHAPEKVKEISNSGFPNAMEMKKGPNSRYESVDFTKRWRVYLLPGSDNFRKEMQTYSWKLDKNGKPTDEPVKWMDHAIDAWKGALYTHMSDSGDVRIRWL